MTHLADQIGSLRDYVRLPFAYNHWYVAGVRAEFSAEPKARTLLNRSIVFYRTGSGALAALQNRCLHRSFPLSEGSVEDDLLVCRYHGIRYGPDGSIARVPAQDRCPSRRLRTFPLREIGPFVFIWMGDEDHPDPERSLPDLPFLTDPSFRTMHDAVAVPGNYLLMHENLQDLTHFAYLHRDTFGVDDYFFDLDMQLERTPEGVSCKYVDTNAARAIRTLPLDLQERASGKPAESWDSNVTLSPGVCKGYAPTFIGGAGSGDREVYERYVMHYLTPETESTTHYWWSISNNFALDDDEYYDLLRGIATAGFEEDIWACRHIQNLLDHDDVDTPELSVRADRAGLLFRRAMVEWVARERADERDEA